MNSGPSVFFGYVVCSGDVSMAKNDPKCLKIGFKHTHKISWEEQAELYHLIGGLEHGVYFSILLGTS